MLNPADEKGLRDLTWHWADAYNIAVTDDTWTAVPHADSATILTADGAMELGEKIRADYAERHPVSDRYLRERMST